MAVTDIVFGSTSGENQGLVVEVSSATYTGVLADITTNSNSGSDQLVEEPKLSPVQISNSRRKVR